mgnify:CR=1 FL=1
MLDSHSFASISDRTIYLLFSKHRFDILFHLLCHVFILTFGYQFLTDLFPTVDLQRSSFFFCSGKLPGAAGPEAGLVRGTRCPHTGPPQAHFLRRWPLPSCTKTHKKPPWQPSGLPRGLCFACVKKQTCSPLPLCRHGARARPGAASAHFLTRGAFGAARRARLQPAARWRRAPASCPASWAYSGVSNRPA